MSADVGNQATLGVDQLLFVEDKWVNTTGDTMTGDLLMSGQDITGVNALSTNSIGGPSDVTLDSGIDASGKRIHGLPDPVAPDDAVTLSHADSFANVSVWCTAVRARAFGEVGT